MFTLIVEHPVSTELQEYIEKYVINDTPHVTSRYEKFLKFVADILGAAWGIPWIQAASSAAVIFPEGQTRVFFGNLFAAGIVTTVGIDGLWIMTACGELFGSKPTEERSLVTRKSSKKAEILNVTIPALCSFLACISPVYAAIKFNKGSKQFLSVFTFFGNYGHGLYGYSRLFKKIMRAIDKKSRDKLSGDTQDQWISKLQTMIDEHQAIPASAKGLVEYVESIHSVTSPRAVSTLKPQRYPPIDFAI